MDLYKVKYNSIEAIALRCFQNAYPESDRVLDQMKSKESCSSLFLECSEVCNDLNISVDKYSDDMNSILNSNSYYTDMCKNDLHLPPVITSNEYTDAIMNDSVKAQQADINTSRPSMVSLDSSIDHAISTSSIGQSESLINQRTPNVIEENFLPALSEEGHQSTSNTQSPQDQMPIVKQEKKDEIDDSDWDIEPVKKKEVVDYDWAVEPVKKEEPLKKVEPEKKEVVDSDWDVEPIKKVEEVKKEESTKKEEPVKKKEVVESDWDIEPIKKEEPINKEEPVKKEEPTKKEEPIKKEEQVKKEEHKKKHSKKESGKKKHTKKESSKKEEKASEEANTNASLFPSLPPPSLPVAHTKRSQMEQKKQEKSSASPVENDYDWNDDSIWAMVDDDNSPLPLSLSPIPDDDLPAEPSSSKPSLSSAPKPPLPSAPKPSLPTAPKPQLVKEEINDSTSDDFEATKWTDDWTENPVQELMKQDASARQDQIHLREQSEEPWDDLDSPEQTKHIPPPLPLKKAESTSTVNTKSSQSIRLKPADDSSDWSNDDLPAEKAATKPVRKPVEDDWGDDTAVRSKPTRRQTMVMSRHSVKAPSVRRQSSPLISNLSEDGPTLRLTTRRPTTHDWSDEDLPSEKPAKLTQTSRKPIQDDWSDDDKPVKLTQTTQKAVQDDWSDDDKPVKLTQTSRKPIQDDWSDDDKPRDKEDDWNSPRPTRKPIQDDWDEDHPSDKPVKPTQSTRKPVQDDWDEDLPSDKPSKPTQPTRRPTTHDWDEDLPSDKPSKPTQSSPHTTSNDWIDLLDEQTQPKKKSPSRNLFSDLFDDISPRQQQQKNNEEDIALKRRKQIESYLCSIPDTSFLADTVINLRY